MLKFKFRRALPKKHTISDDRWILEYGKKYYGHIHIRFYTEKRKKKAYIYNMYLTPEAVANKLVVTLSRLVMKKVKERGVDLIRIESFGEFSP